MSSLLISKALNEYAEQFTTPESKELAALNRETNLKRGDAVMLSGHLQGALLKLFSKMARPRRILEIGTYTGYSAICLAMGLQDDGKLHTIEIDEELFDLADKYITASGLRDKIVQHIGAAAEVIGGLDESFDMVFIDADKINYERYYDLVFDRVPVGGYIIADNVLYDGEVVMPADEQSKNARAISAFNKKVKADHRIEHMLVPVRDGLMVVRKIKD
jgi:caffeoyl-CoA O-methyltransferase